MHVYVGGYVARGPDTATQQGEGRYGIYQGGLPDLGVQIHNSQLHLHFRYMNNRIVAVFPFICNSDEVLHPVFYLANALSRMLCNTGGDRVRQVKNAVWVQDFGQSWEKHLDCHDK